MYCKSLKKAYTILTLLITYVTSGFNRFYVIDLATHKPMWLMSFPYTTHTQLKVKGLTVYLYWSWHLTLKMHRQMQISFARRSEVARSFFSLLQICINSINKHYFIIFILTIYFLPTVQCNYFIQRITAYNSEYNIMSTQI